MAALKSFFASSFLALSALATPVEQACGSSNSNRLSTCSRASFNLVQNDSGIWPYREYKTSKATPPMFDVQTQTANASDGSIFLTMQNTGLAGFPGCKQESTLMLSPSGDLVWAGPLEANTSDFRGQTFNNESVITYWTGARLSAPDGSGGHGYGTVQILNSNYETIYSVCPKMDITFLPGQEYPCVADVHESYITPENTMLMAVYNLTQADLTSVGGPKDGWIQNSMAIEVDIKTNEILFVWNPLDHVSFNDSKNLIGTQGKNISAPWDWFHVNSIHSLNGGFLVNSRQTWSSYFVNRNGSIEWELNGLTGGDFGILGPREQFRWAHDARIYNVGENKILFTCFNDDNSTPLVTENPSTGLGLILELPPNKLKTPPISNYMADLTSPQVSFVEGSYSVLDNGNAFLGYGYRPFVREFGNQRPTLGGNLVYSAQFAYDNLNNTASSYRAFKSVWNATPTTPLSLVVEKADHSGLDHCACGSEMRGYVSWNGATEVSGYSIYTGSTKGKLHNTGIVFKKKTFETEFVVPSGAAYIQVVALQGKKELGKSAVIPVSNP